jgi:hypothetical protein
VLTFPFLRVCIIYSIRILALYLVATTPDLIWNNIRVANWPYIELNAAVTYVSLSTLKPLISRLFPNLLPAAGNPDYDNFTAGINVKIIKFALEAVGGSAKSE